MKKDRFEEWLQRIYGTREKEISCTECFDQVSRFVDLELAGGDPAAGMTEVVQHLSQCAACREEYELLRDLRRFEDEGGAPTLGDLRDAIH